MYRDRGGSGLRPEIGAIDRKRINDALDKHLEKSATSTSKGMNGKDKDRLAVPSSSAGKLPSDHRDARSVTLSKNKCSDGQFLSQSLSLSLSLALVFQVIGETHFMFQLIDEAHFMFQVIDETHFMFSCVYINLVLMLFDRVLHGSSCLITNMEEAFNAFLWTP